MKSVVFPKSLKKGDKIAIIYDSAATSKVKKYTYAQVQAEVEKIAEFIGEQKGYASAFMLPEYSSEETTSTVGAFDPNEKDALFEDAARIIVSTQQGSTSMLQRQLKLGYNRAGRIMDQLEASGIVGGFNGAKAREVLISDLHSLEQFLRDLRS